jgi:rhodanese-related sulfurtransferase
MGLNLSIHKLNFEGMQNIINNSREKFLIINTLDANNQHCLIKNTLSPSREIEEITRFLKEDKNINIVIYGENSIDSKVVEKYNQLYKLGFANLYVYIGGLFEWLFPTTSKIVDILKYKGKSII